MTRTGYALAMLLFMLPFQVLRSEGQNLSDRADLKLLDRITVIGDVIEQRQLAGSAAYLSPKQLEDTKKGHDDIHRALRQVPGVNIQEEDGYGLRPNIGFRGVSVERSSSITLMEDGVLIAPAPYSASSAYFFPPFGRMEALEVVKGASQIKYGPRTTGGSLNLFSTSVPDTFSAKLNTRFGSNSTKIAHINIGDSYKHAGWLLETYQAESDGFKDLENGADTGYDIADYLGKIRFNTDPDAVVYQELELKFNNYDQTSNETYLGLTESDFKIDPFKRYAASQLDRMDVDHDQFQIQHYLEASNSVDVTTVAYYNKTKRNWYKLQSAGGNSLHDVLDDPASFADSFSWIQGSTSPDDALAIRANNREYYSKGIQTVLGIETELGETLHELEVGLRLHEDEEDRYQHEDSYKMENGTMILTSTGAPGSNANRIGSANAIAAFIQDKISYSDVTVTPGLRYESVNFKLEDFGKEDPGRTGEDLSTVRTSNNVLIPGIGLHYQVVDAFGAFFGIHKGFQPAGPTSSPEVKEEESINYELGARGEVGSFRSEATLFYNDYDNLLGADTASAGGAGTGDLFNAGQATSYGIEVAAGLDLAEFISNKVSLPVAVNYTYTNAEFDQSFDSELFGLVMDGDRLPYIPEHQASIHAGVEYKRVVLSLNGHFVDEMPTFAGASGSRAEDFTDSYFVVDATGELKLSDKVKLFVSANNLFDEEYVVARRPAGARPGLPLSVFAGIKVNI